MNALQCMTEKITKLKIKHKKMIREFKEKLEKDKKIEDIIKNENLKLLCDLNMKKEYLINRIKNTNTRIRRIGAARKSYY